MLNGDCFGFVLELFETGDSFVTADAGLIEEAPIVMLCVAGLVDGAPLSVPLGALLLGALPATALGAPSGKLVAFSMPLLAGDKSILVVSFVWRKPKIRLQIGNPKFELQVNLSKQSNYL